MALKIFTILIGMGISCTVLAQRATVDGRFWAYHDRELAKFSPLIFSVDIKELGFFSTPSNQVLKPAGSQPFPTVVLVPTCGGMKPSTRTRMKEFLDAGYAVLAVDSYTSRGEVSCRKDVIRPPLVMRDTFDALKHLQQFPEIDKQRIFVVGYSMGSFAAAWVASPHNAKESGSELRFTASVGHYGSCILHPSPLAPNFPFLRRDIDRPVLLLVGEADAETPMSSCFPLVEEMKADGKPVDWHIYRDVTHAWDQPESSGYTFNNQFGKDVTYTYSRETTVDATRRTLEFLGRFK